MKSMKGLIVMMLILASWMTVGVASANDGNLVATNQVQSSTAWIYFVSCTACNGDCITRSIANNRWFGGAQCTARASFNHKSVTTSAW